MEALIGGTILVVIAAILTLFLCVTEEESYLKCVIFLIFICSVLGMVLLIRYRDNLSENKPQAIDVYRGNTTLQITYQDSIAIDTVVIFKRQL